MFNSKLFIWIGLFIGSTVGAYIPTLWGDSVLSLSSVIFSAIFSIIGIWIGYKAGENL